MDADEAIAREAIRTTMALYVQNSDNADYDRHHEVFHKEAEMAVQGGRILKGPDEIITAMRAGAQARGAFEPGNYQRHNLTTSMVEFTSASTANGKTYIMVFTELGLDHTGSYTDQFERVGDAWLIRRRQANMEWARPESRFLRWLGKPMAPATPEGPKA